jgi:hypothetical protein
LPSLLVPLALLFLDEETAREVSLTLFFFTLFTVVANVVLLALPPFGPAWLYRHASAYLQKPLLPLDRMENLGRFKNPNDNQEKTFKNLTSG